MSDIVVAAQDLPAISLSKNYIDFGQAGVRVRNDALRIPETFCLTNHSQSDVLIKWDQGSLCTNDQCLALQTRFFCSGHEHPSRNFHNIFLMSTFPLMPTLIF